MRAARALKLKREALAELTAGELTYVAAGDADTLVYCKVSQVINPCTTRNDPACDMLSRAMQCLTPGCP